MQFFITGIHVNTSEAFRTHVEGEILKLSEHYRLSPLEVKVNVSRPNHVYRTEVSLHLRRGVYLRSHGEGESAYNSFDTALRQLEGRLQRHKERLVAHHKHQDTPHRYEVAQHYVVDREGEAPESAALAPPVIAEMETEVPYLTVSDAVMRLDLAQETVLLFFNEAHGRLNVVYRRNDGNIGWLDPATKSAP